MGKSALKRLIRRPLADVNAAFRERAGARKRADIFLHRKTEQSELCSDVVEGDGIIFVLLYHFLIFIKNATIGYISAL